MNLFIILIVTTIIVVVAVQLYFFTSYDELDDCDDFECVVEPPKRGNK